MNILDQIVARKKDEVIIQRIYVPVAELERQPLFERPVISFREAIADPFKKGLIAEFKRKSPTEGFIHEQADVAQVTAAYAAAGASALSVLTDNFYFGGSSNDLQTARKNEEIPLLRKDFIVDEYQVFEAKAMGADAVLLIASALSTKEVLLLALRAKSLQLEVLLELHSLDELDRLNPYVDVVGVNNRNLSSFKTTLQNSMDLYPYLPAEMFKISESGIHTPEDVRMLRNTGYDGFLVGTAFMKKSDPGLAFQQFIQQC
jgi:indole-3-glycerol phosphate synthase